MSAHAWAIRQGMPEHLPSGDQQLWLERWQKVKSDKITRLKEDIQCYEVMKKGAAVRNADLEASIVRLTREVEELTPDAKKWRALEGALKVFGQDMELIVRLKATLDHPPKDDT